MKQVILYCRSEGIKTIYTTAVSDESRALLSNKKLENAVRLLAEKEEKRLVYKIEVDDLPF